MLRGCMSSLFCNVLISHGILALFMKEKIKRERKIRLTIIMGACEKGNSEIPHTISQCQHPACRKATSLHAEQRALSLSCIVKSIDQPIPKD